MTKYEHYSGEEIKKNEMEKTRITYGGGVEKCKLCFRRKPERVYL